MKTDELTVSHQSQFGLGIISDERLGQDRLDLYGAR